MGASTKNFCKLSRFWFSVWWEVWVNLLIRKFVMKIREEKEHEQKEACIFHLILVAIPSSMILSVKNKRWGVLNGQNLLSVTKVICWWSLCSCSGNGWQLLRWGERPSGLRHWNWNWEVPSSNPTSCSAWLWDPTLILASWWPSGWTSRKRSD